MVLQGDNQEITCFGCGHAVFFLHTFIELCIRGEKEGEKRNSLNVKSFPPETVKCPGCGSEFYLNYTIGLAASV